VEFAAREHALEDVQRLEVFDEFMARFVFVAPSVANLIGHHLDALDSLLELLGTEKDGADLRVEVVADLVVPFGNIVSSKQELVVLDDKARLVLVGLLEQRIASLGASQSSLESLGDPLSVNAGEFTSKQRQDS